MSSGTDGFAGRRFDHCWVSLLMNTSFPTEMQVGLKILLDPILSFGGISHVLEVLIPDSNNEFNI
uniref:Uncharacterized protein n=1 Tax=Salix viminalis TaxID=40686 RepID=A0A6N2LFT2_SALVM